MSKAPSDSPAPASRVRRATTSKNEVMLQALNLFAEHMVVDMSIRDISRKLDTNPGTVHRALATLIDHDMLIMVDDRYHLGPACEALAAALQGSSPNRLVQSYLEELRDRAGETCAVTEVFHKTKAVTAQAECREAMRMSLELGRILPVVGSVSDRLIVAFDGPDVLDMPDPVPAPLRMSAEQVEEIRSRGWDYGKGAIAMGAMVVGVPFEGREGRTKVLIVFGPEERMMLKGPDHYAELAKETARRLELAGRARSAPPVVSAPLAQTF